MSSVITERIATLVVISGNEKIAQLNIYINGSRLTHSFTIYLHLTTPLSRENLWRISARILNPKRGSVMIENILKMLDPLEAE